MDADEKKKLMEKMDTDAQAADADWETIQKTLNAANMVGVKALMAWIDKWYLKAGYKRLIYAVRARLK